MIIRCSCAKVELEATDEPLLCVACHCSDCHEGSRRIESLPNAAPALDSYGGTPHLLYRKDRLKYVKGNDLVKGLKVDTDSPTRAYASCCNSYLLMDLPAPMQWAPVSRFRFLGALPPTEFRINVKTKPTPNDVPCYRAIPFKFIAKLLSSRIAMMFGR